MDLSKAAAALLLVGSKPSGPSTMLEKKAKETPGSSNTENKEADSGSEKKVSSFLVVPMLTDPRHPVLHQLQQPDRVTLYCFGVGGVAWDHAGWTQMHSWIRYEIGK